MFIRVKPIGNTSRKRVQICACKRVDGKVKQKVVKHVGIAENDSQLEELTKLAEALKTKIQEEGEGFSLQEFPLEKTETSEKPVFSNTSEELELINIGSIVEEKRIVEGFHDIFGTLFNQLGFQHILNNTQTSVLRDVVLARIASPVGKSATQQILAADFGREIELDRIYRMMDFLVEKKETVQKVVFSATEELCFEKVDPLFFDVTTLYFQSTEEDELSKFGDSKEQKPQLTQVNLALATASNGLPIGYYLFSGNVADASTLVNGLDTWKKTLPVGQVRVVADRAMLSEENLKSLEGRQIQYLFAASDIGKKIFHSRKQFDVTLDKTESGRRLLVLFSSKRAPKDERGREHTLQRLEEIRNWKSLKEFFPDQDCQNDVFSQKEATFSQKIEKERGPLQGLITNCLEEDAETLLADYKRLWSVEEYFRIQKHNILPTYHFKTERLEAHILICYLAFALIRHLEFRVKIQEEKIRIKDVRTELWRVQSTYLKDAETGKTYRLPSKINTHVKKLYQIMAIKRLETIQPM